MNAAHSSITHVSSGTAPTATGRPVRALLRRAALTTAACAVLALGVGAPTAAASEAAPSHQPAVTAIAPAADPTQRFSPTWCPFGTHHGKGSGCRGGSINDNQAVNSYLRQERVLWRDATRCAFVGLGAPAGAKPPTSIGTYGLNAGGAALACGAATQDQHLRDMEAARRGTGG